MMSESDSSDSNPYRSNTVTAPPITPKHPTREIVWFAGLQFLFLIAIVFIVMYVVPNAFRMCMEFGVELPGISIATFAFAERWHLAIPFLFLAFVAATIVYALFSAARSKWTRVWWYLVLGGWLALFLLLVAGIAYPIISIMRELN